MSKDNKNEIADLERLIRNLPDSLRNGAYGKVYRIRLYSLKLGTQAFSGHPMIDRYIIDED